MIIGLTGTNAAGKGEAADYLVKKGFSYFSLSDVIRDESKKEGKEPTRENMISKGNELRENFGAGVLAKKIIEKIDINKNCVVDSIRNPHEVEELRKLKGFIFIAVDAPVEVRFEREKKRKRETAVETFEEFKALDDEEREGDEKSQQLNRCIELADCNIINDGTLGDLHKKIDGVLNG